ncbi:hypothetical protein [Pedobacter namyangjuensis]|uniref:hypothetical protein n=1 Tax=Pedobacter namyangjuensis TaxID=600626 RepID=UPI0013B3E9FE|nr:hypothetical protein [Pedobacter namyangjuensis]
MPGYINSNWMSFNYTVTYDAPYGCIVGANTGTQVTSYKVNPDMNVPIDDHIWIVILLTTALTAFYLSKSRSVIAS